MKPSTFSLQASTDTSMAKTGTTFRKPVSSLPSSFTPFYPRSQQQLYYSGMSSAPMEASENNVCDTYLQESSNMYSQSNYACQGSENFELSWIHEGCYGESNWICPGTGWQYGGSPYVDNTAYQSMSSKNQLSLLSSVSPQGNFVVGSSTYQNNTALPIRDGCQSSKMEVLVNQQESVGGKISECNGKNSENQVGLRHDILGGNPAFKKVSAASSTDDNRAAKEEVAKNGDKCSIQTQSIDKNNCKYKNQVGENIDIKDTVNISANEQDRCNPLKVARFTSPLTCSTSLPSVIGQADPPKTLKCEVALSLDSYDAGNQKIQSAESKICQSSVEDTTQIVADFGSGDVTSVHEENIGLNKSQAVVEWDGYQLVMKSIYHLSKVILRSKSGNANRGSAHRDLAIEKSLYMLSLSLLQKLHTDDNEDVMPKINQESSGNYLSSDVLKDEMDAQSILSILHQGSMSFPCQTKPCRKTQGADINENIPSAHEKHNMNFENASIKKQISEMKCNLTQLQDDIAYERSESNATVLMYKKLWNDARTELEASKLEIRKINAEIEGIKNQFQKLKDTDSSRINCYTSCCKKPADIECTEITGEDLAHGNKVQTEFVKSIKLVRSDTVATECMDAPSDQAYVDSENNKVPCLAASFLQRTDTMEYTKHLESDVAQRLSMLLARPKLGVNMSCHEKDEPLSDCHDSSDCSGYAMKEDWSKLSSVKDKKSPSWGGTLYNELSHISTKYAMNCERQENWDSEEDEIEIICLRPSDIGNQVISIRGEAEWEHIEAGGKHT